MWSAAREKRRRDSRKKSGTHQRKTGISAPRSSRRNLSLPCIYPTISALPNLHRTGIKPNSPQHPTLQPRALNTRYRYSSLFCGENNVLPREHSRPKHETRESLHVRARRGTPGGHTNIHSPYNTKRHLIRRSAVDVAPHRLRGEVRTLLRSARVAVHVGAREQKDAVRVPGKRTNDKKVETIKHKSGKTDPSSSRSAASVDLLYALLSPTWDKLFPILLVVITVYRRRGRGRHHEQNNKNICVQGSVGFGRRKEASAAAPPPSRAMPSTRVLCRCCAHAVDLWCRFYSRSSDHSPGKTRGT